MYTTLDPTKNGIMNHRSAPSAKIRSTQHTKIKLYCCPHKFHIGCLKHAFIWDTKCPVCLCRKSKYLIHPQSELVKQLQANIHNVNDDSEVQIISDDERPSENDTTTSDEYDFDDIQDEDNIMECTICARQINGNKASVITKCRQTRRGHYCHKTCLDNWITAIEPTNSFSKTCPANNCNNLADSYFVAWRALTWTKLLHFLIFDEFVLTDEIVEEFNEKLKTKNCVYYMVKRLVNRLKAFG
ncbi:hypothetical protein B4U80_14076 [Leptotrombidium deliense]|uniref:Uncharacterized protein n=1 Tax=Leptotrombidium deliense TaxID=299467 RepID=A0A443S375_9ACAR|nr:hypothetical protein B4U80_14076 [Leptotrombidium deliense]